MRKNSAVFFAPAANSVHEKSVARCGGESRQQRKLLLFLLSFMFNFTRQNCFARNHHGKAASTAEKPASKLIRWFNRGVAFASAFVLIAVNKVLNLNVRMRERRLSVWSAFKKVFREPFPSRLSVTRFRDRVERTKLETKHFPNFSSTSKALSLRMKGSIMRSVRLVSAFSLSSRFSRKFTRLKIRAMGVGTGGGVSRFQKLLNC